MRMYGPKRRQHGNVLTTRKVGQVRWSKNFYYETPCIVTGDTKLAGPEQEPKGIYVRIELSERGKLFHISMLKW